MASRTTNENSAKKTKAKGAASLKKAVGNSKTPTKKKAGGTSAAGSGASPQSSEHAPGTVKPPVLLKGKSLKEFFQSAPITTGVLKRPTYREREFEWQVTIGVEDARRETLKVLMDYPGGQYVVAMFFPIHDVSEWPAWDQFNTGEILQAHHRSDFERTFEVSSAFMASVLGFTPTRLRQIENEGHAVKFGRGRWDLVGTVKAYLEYLRDEFQGRGGKEYSSERTRKLRASAGREEVKLAQENEELGYIEDFESEQMELALKYREAMELIPEAIAERLAKKPVHVIKRELAEEIKGVLVQLGIQASKPNGSSTGKAKRKQAPKSGGRKKRSS